MIIFIIVYNIRGIRIIYTILSFISFSTNCHLLQWTQVKIYQGVTLNVHTFRAEPKTAPFQPHWHALCMRIDSWCIHTNKYMRIRDFPRIRNTEAAGWCRCRCVLSTGYPSVLDAAGVPHPEVSSEGPRERYFARKTRTDRSASGSREKDG